MNRGYQGENYRGRDNSANDRGYQQSGESWKTLTRPRPNPRNRKNDNKNTGFNRGQREKGRGFPRDSRNYGHSGVNWEKNAPEWHYEHIGRIDSKQGEYDGKEAETILRNKAHAVTGNDHEQKVDEDSVTAGKQNTNEQFEGERTHEKRGGVIQKELQEVDISSEKSGKESISSVEFDRSEESKKSEDQPKTGRGPDPAVLSNDGSASELESHADNMFLEFGEDAQLEADTVKGTSDVCRGYSNRTDFTGLDFSNRDDIDEGIAVDSAVQRGPKSILKKKISDPVPVDPNSHTTPQKLRKRKPFSNVIPELANLDSEDEDNFLYGDVIGEDSKEMGGEIDEQKIEKEIEETGEQDGTTATSPKLLSVENSYKEGSPTDGKKDGHNKFAEERTVVVSAERIAVTVAREEGYYSPISKEGSYSPISEEGSRLFDDDEPERDNANCYTTERNTRPLYKERGVSPSYDRTRAHSSELTVGRGRFSPKSNERWHSLKRSSQENIHQREPRERVSVWERLSPRREDNWHSPLPLSPVSDRSEICSPRRSLVREKYTPIREGRAVSPLPRLDRWDNYLPQRRSRSRSPVMQYRERSIGSRSPLMQYRERSPGIRSPLMQYRERSPGRRSPVMQYRERSPGTQYRERSPGNRSPGFRYRERSPRGESSGRKFVSPSPERRGHEYSSSFERIPFSSPRSRDIDYGMRSRYSSDKGLGEGKRQPSDYELHRFHSLDRNSVDKNRSRSRERTFGDRRSRSVSSERYMKRRHQSRSRSSERSYKRGKYSRSPGRRRLWSQSPGRRRSWSRSSSLSLSSGDSYDKKSPIRVPKRAQRLKHLDAPGERVLSTRRGSNTVQKNDYQSQVIPHTEPRKNLKDMLNTTGLNLDYSRKEQNTSAPSDVWQQQSPITGHSKQNIVLPQGPPPQGPPPQGPLPRGPPLQGPLPQGPPSQGPPPQRLPPQGPIPQRPPLQRLPFQGPSPQGPPPHVAPPHVAPPQGPPPATAAPYLPHSTPNFLPVNIPQHSSEYSGTVFPSLNQPPVVLPYSVQPATSTKPVSTHFGMDGCTTVSVPPPISQQLSVPSVSKSAAAVSQPQQPVSNPESKNIPRQLSLRTSDRKICNQGMSRSNLVQIKTAGFDLMQMKRGDFLVQINTDENTPLSSSSGLSTTEHEKIIRQRERYTKTLEVLQKQLLRLKEKERDLELKGHEKNEKLLKENDKLQREVLARIRVIQKDAIGRLNDMLGGEEDQETEEKVATEEKDSVSKTKKEIKKEEKKEFSSLDVSEVVFFDPENHWCNLCDVFPRTAKEMLIHLHNPKHMEKQKQNLEQPWHKKMTTAPVVKRRQRSGPKVPIRGLEFMLPVTAWYCKLCDEWIGDLHCAAQHLKSKGHNDKYTWYKNENPDWEKSWWAQRQKAAKRVAEQQKREEEKWKAEGNPIDMGENENSDISETTACSDKGKSIWVKMRNKGREECVGSKPNVRDNVSLTHLYEESQTDKLMDEWMTEVPKESDTQKHALENLKDKMKQKQQEEALKEKVAREKERVSQAELSKEKKKKEDQKPIEQPSKPNAPKIAFGIGKGKSEHNQKPSGVMGKRGKLPFIGRMPALRSGPKRSQQTTDKTTNIENKTEIQATEKFYHDLKGHGKIDHEHKEGMNQSEDKEESVENLSEIIHFEESENTVKDDDIPKLSAAVTEDIEEVDTFVKENIDTIVETVSEDMAKLGATVQQDQAIIETTAHQGQVIIDATAQQDQAMRDSSVKQDEVRISTIVKNELAESKKEKVTLARKEDTDVDEFNKFSGPKPASQESVNILEIPLPGSISSQSVKVTKANERKKKTVEMTNEKTDCQRKTIAKVDPRKVEIDDELKMLGIDVEDIAASTVRITGCKRIK